MSSGRYGRVRLLPLSYSWIQPLWQNPDMAITAKARPRHNGQIPTWQYRMDFGVWTESSRGTYNKWDGIARTTAQVYPGAWTAILVSLDNVGTWNLRTENLDSWYLGEETYIRVVNPEDPLNKTSLGKTKDVSLFRPQDVSSAVSVSTNPIQLLFSVLVIYTAVLVLR